jgi:hypothetical protein
VFQFLVSSSQYRVGAQCIAKVEVIDKGLTARGDDVQVMGARCALAKEAPVGVLRIVNIDR